VSHSPYRVPIAKLAMAQAALAEGGDLPAVATDIAGMGAAALSTLNRFVAAAAEGAE